MPMSRKIAMEVLDALQLQGKAYGKKLELHKLAEANRAYANLR
jgi:ribosomal protein S7